MTDQENIDPAEAQRLADIELSEEVALHAMQGMLSHGHDPQVAASHAWMVAVPAFFQGRVQFYQLQEKLWQAAQQQTGT